MRKALGHSDAGMTMHDLNVDVAAPTNLGVDVAAKGARDRGETGVSA